MAGVSRPTSRWLNRRGLTTTWETVNPVLGDGEMGIEVILNGPERVKFGDGTTHWNDLEYAAGSGATEEITEEVLAALEPVTPLLTVYLNARGA